MDKKKIALFTSGQGFDISHKIAEGLKEGFTRGYADIYMFLTYAIMVDPPDKMKAGLNVMNLADLNDYDGAVIVCNCLDFPGLTDDLMKQCTDAGIPYITTGRRVDDTYYVNIDNYSAMKSMCDHLIEMHGVKRLLYIAGTEDNEDSNIRLEAVRESAGSHGLKFDTESNVFFSDWEPYNANCYLNDIITSGGELADAILCANDVLAMNVCNTLTGKGIRVPEDVKVTGFDNDFLARIYEPSICSVDQNFKQAGIECARAFEEIFAGGRSRRDIYVSSFFNPSESCGCVQKDEIYHVIRKMGKNRYIDLYNDTMFDRELKYIETIIMNSPTYADMEADFRKNYAQEHDFAGDFMYLCLDPMYEKNIYNPERKLKTEGYSRIMRVVYGMVDGEVMQETEEIESRKLVPTVYKDDNTHVYIITNLYDNNENYGYIVLADGIERIDDYRLLRYKEKLSQVLKSFKQTVSLSLLNLRLLELTETDSLTHVKNRTAFEAKAEEIKKKIRFNSNLEFAVAMFDVNNLKTVNDEFGHDAGDEYIINSCMMICKIFKRSPVYRMGGDEFAALLMGDDFIMREELLRELRRKIKDLDAADIPVYEKLSVASGVAVFEQGVDLSLNDVYKKADKEMYDNKLLMKKGNVR
ncbi:MAG: GGDEF domain-containing protein [Lachnospiraceae bacterium]|nr:GGDEF domain-containing protein [Lachnospiraceae bacterium]